MFRGVSFGRWKGVNFGRWLTTLLNGKLAEAINRELIKISIVNIRWHPKYIRAEKSKDKVNKFREAAIESLKRRLKKDSSYLAEFRTK